MRAQPGTVLWFFAQEFRLQWRELWQGFIGTGELRSVMLVTFFGLLAFGMHALAVYLLAPFVEGGVTPSLDTLSAITASASFFITMSLSQAIEAVTRAYYSRGDFDLILSSPAPARYVFWARTAMLTLTSAFFAVFMVSPFVNVLIVLDGPHWVTAYVLALIMSGSVTALAVFITLGLFQTIGPRYTRLAAQILSALVGAALFVGIQTSLILSRGGPGSITDTLSGFFRGAAGGADSWVFVPARAAMGDWGAMASLLATSLLLIMAALAISGRSFSRLALAALNETERPAHREKAHRFSGAGAMALLRRKEWILVRRDPWLISQSLMQLLYLIPLLVLMLLTAGNGSVAAPVLSAMLAMAAGQLSGGLAWLTLSGEQAHDLVLTAPLPRRAIYVAKVEAIAAMVAVVILPVLIGLAFFFPRVLPIAASGALLASASAISVQYLFRGRGDRRHFARREGSPRLATFVEALAAVAWAGATGVAAINPLAGLIAAVPAVLIVLSVWLVRRNAVPA